MKIALEFPTCQRRQGEAAPKPIPSPAASARPSRTCGPERLIPAPDCGMKYIPRETASAKLKALAEGAAIVQRELRDA